MNEKLEDVIIEAVQGRLVDWGTSAKIDKWDNKENVSLRIVMNQQCNLLIDDLIKDIGEYLKGNTNGY